MPNLKIPTKYKLIGDKDVTINHIISECSKLVRKNLTRLSDQLGIVKKFEIRQDYQIVNAQNRIRPVNETEFLRYK